MHPTTGKALFRTLTDATEDSEFAVRHYAKDHATISVGGYQDATAEPRPVPLQRQQYPHESAPVWLTFSIGIEFRRAPTERIRALENHRCVKGFLGFAEPGLPEGLFRTCFVNGFKVLKVRASTAKLILN